MYCLHDLEEHARASKRNLLTKPETSKKLDAKSYNNITYRLHACRRGELASYQWSIATSMVLRALDTIIYMSYKIYFACVQDLINDPMYPGGYHLHPLMKRIINTPEFHRLKNIKQLGNHSLLHINEI